MAGYPESNGGGGGVLNGPDAGVNHFIPLFLVLVRHKLPQTEHQLVLLALHMQRQH
jgi:hypothetical protein